MHIPTEYIYIWDVSDLEAFIECCKTVDSEAKNPTGKVYTEDSLDEWR